MAIDYSQKHFWSLQLLEETLKNYTVLRPNENGNFDLLWLAKLECEKAIGGVIRPA